MPTSLLTDTLRAKRTAFFIAAFITWLALGSQAAEANPAKVRFDDRGPGQTVPEKHRGGSASPETATRRVVVSAVHQEKDEVATPGQTDPVATATGKPVPTKHPDHRARNPWLLIIFIIVTLFVIWRILRLQRPEETPGQPGNSYKPPVYSPRIAIKFKSGSGQPPQQIDGLQVSVRDAKRLVPLQIFPLFESLDSHSLGELVDSALENDPSYKPPDLLAWFQVETPPGINAQQLIKPLRELDKVETAYLMRPVPPPVSASDDPLNPLQGYEDAAPDGINARYAWDFTGGDGAGIGFVDLEEAWNLNHQDLKSANITIISGRNHGDHSHGTAVLGQVLMVDNTKGGVGIAPSAQGRVISQWRTRSSYNTADAIADAATKMLPGDVLLLEAQEFNPDGVEGDKTVWPVEIADASYDAISLATAKGIVVVEAGANGGQDLDTYKNASGQKIFNRNSPDFRDSGAIMVGAGSSIHPHCRLEFSNYGNRIDCYAWGENIETTSTNMAGKRNTMYRSDFKGTSGASPMIAGAALILQGIRQAALDRGMSGKRFTPQELRDLLTANGTPSKTPATDKIGVMPDLHAIITHNLIKLSPVPVPTSAPS